MYLKDHAKKSLLLCWTDIIPRQHFIFTVKIQGDPRMSRYYTIFLHDSRTGSRRSIIYYSPTSLFFTIRCPDGKEPHPTRHAHPSPARSWGKIIRNYNVKTMSICGRRGRRAILTKENCNRIGNYPRHVILVYSLCEEHFRLT